MYCKLISNSNWTEWSTILGVIELVISKSSNRTPVIGHPRDRAQIINNYWMRFL